MPKAQHLLLLAKRPDLLDRLYETSVASGVTLTVVSDPVQFSTLASRAAFQGYILDVDLTGKQTWSLFQDAKLRQPAAFFALVTARGAEEGLRAAAAGLVDWHALHLPVADAELATLKPVLQKQPSVYVEDSGDPARAAALKAALGGATAGSLKEAAELLAKNPKTLAVVHAAKPETSHAAFLLEASKLGARALLVCDQPLEEAARHAVRNAGWFAVPAAQGVPFVLDRLQESGGGGAAGKPAPDRVLVVDDEPNILDFVVDILSDHGYDVDGQPSGTAAIAAMKSKEYNVALVDFQLGDMTGLTLSRELRAIDPDLNVILMTAHASLDMAVKAIQADVYDYLIKPVDTSHLKRSLGKALEKRRLALEIKALVADLQRANHQLNRLNDLKSRFLSIVTHDLRTPLTSIKGYAQVLTMQKNLPADQQQHFLKVIAHEADHLAALIADLMDFVSIEAGKLRVEKAPGSLPELVENLRDRMASLAEQRKIVFRVELKTPDIPPLEMDRRRIDQVVTNLTTNAFKHTPEGGSVTVSAELKDGVVRVQVADSGEGIPPKDLPRIFEQFYQVESHASKREGIGLGLSICKEIVQAHGGEIGVESEGPGKGSRFWFTLPAAGGK